MESLGAGIGQDLSTFAQLDKGKDQRELWKVKFQALDFLS